MLQDPKTLENPLGAFGDRSHSNILMRFVVVAGKRCFIQTKMSCTEIAPVITFPWESFQSIWGQFISREGSKREPWSSKSESRCFNGNNERKNKSILGKGLKSLVLVPHRNKNTFPDLGNLNGRALLISSCQKLHGPTEKGLARRSFAGPATPWPPTPRLDFGGDITHLLLLSALLPCLPRNLWQRWTAWCFALLFLLKCEKWFTRNKKSSFGPRNSHLHGSFLHLRVLLWPRTIYLAFTQEPLLQTCFFFFS